MKTNKNNKTAKTTFNTDGVKLVKRNLKGKTSSRSGLRDLIAQELKCSTRTAYRLINKLDSEGKLVSKTSKTGEVTLKVK